MSGLDAPVVIAYSIGDLNGIGPEVLLKALSSRARDGNIHVVYANGTLFNHPSLHPTAAAFGSLTPLMDIQKARVELAPGVYLVECVPDELVTIEPGRVSAQSGRASMISFEAAMRDTISGAADALVTAPISKEAIRAAGWSEPGHTEILGKACGVPDPLMMMVHDRLRVGLQTIHIPLHQVAASIRKEAIEATLGRFTNALRTLFGVPSPRIAVLGLNPHAGDGGVIGREEIEQIRPAIEAHNARLLAETLGVGTEAMPVPSGAVAMSGVETMTGTDAGQATKSAEGRHAKYSADAINATTAGAFGPFPADGFFARGAWREYDGVLAMYHDQGLIPFKTLAGSGGVNVTAGLPIIRTSPDHGTGFDIAGRDIASPDSMLDAIDLAIALADRRRRTRDDA